MKKISIFNGKSKRDNISNGLDVYSKRMRWQVKDLYFADPALVTHAIEEESEFIYYNKRNENNESIIVVKIDEKFVKDVLTGRIYGIFSKFKYEELYKFVDKYMVGNLHPLELYLFDKSKMILRRKDIIDILSSEQEYDDKVYAKEYSDILLCQISETNKRIIASSLDDSVKDEMREKLLNIANYYASSLKGCISINNHSLATLRKECVELLIEIEMMLPPDSINKLEEEVNLLENEIKKLKR